MKIILYILLIFSFEAWGQNFHGHFKDNFGNELTLNKDSTFLNVWRFDITSLWQTGVWTIHKDTVYFYPRQVIDTIDCNGKDSLILSSNLTADRIPCDSSHLFTGYSNYQRDSLPPNILVLKGDRLYNLTEDGKLLKRATGRQRKVSIRKYRLDKPEIVLLTWTKKIPAYYYRLEE